MGRVMESAQWELGPWNMAGLLVLSFVSHCIDREYPLMSCASRDLLPLNTSVVNSPSALFQSRVYPQQQP